MNPLRTACMFAAAAAAALAGGVFAQAPAVPPPLPPPLPADAAPTPLPATGAQPLTDYTAEADLESQVTIIRKDAETVEEVRIGGVLRYVRVTPRHGRPYYLVPTGNGQSFTRHDSLGSGLSVPMWLLFSW